MSYTETIEYLYNLAPAFENHGVGAYKPGLGNMLQLMDALGNPHRQITCIHVAGTNGKGSTCHTLAAILQSAGYKTGLYTSPHLVDFGERIRIDGKMIDKKFVVEFVQNNEELIRTIEPSFFEVVTAMAFCWFRECQTDINVIETGLGGRLDSTNVITPLLSIITNIGFDHTDLLGNTLEMIAHEKAGIIKPNVPVVVGERQAETSRVFEQVAQKANSQLTFADSTSLPSDLLSSFQLKGLCQSKNLRTVMTAVEVLRHNGISISEVAVANGLSHVCDLTGLKGRWQTISTNPTVICDIGHNAHGIATVARQLKQLTAPLHIVFGMLRDKNVDECLDLMPKNASYYFTQPDSHRAMTSDEMTTLARQHGLQGTAYENPNEAIKCALKNAKKEDIIFVGGSNYLVGTAMQYFS